MRAAAGVGADQYLPPLAAGQLGQREPGHLDVLAGGVRSGVPGAQHDGQRLPARPGAVVGERGERVEAVVFFQVGAAFSFSNPHRFAGRCARQRLQRTGWSAGQGALEPVAVDVVGEVADEAGVVHAEGGGGELGVQVGDELGDPGLPAGGGVVAAGPEPPGEVGAVAAAVAGAGGVVTITWGLSVRSSSRWARQACSAAQLAGSAGAGNGRPARSGFAAQVIDAGDGQAADLGVGSGVEQG